MKLLNVGCGKRPVELVLKQLKETFGAEFTDVEFINLDKTDSPIVDCIRDLDNLENEKLPWKDGTFNAIVMFHVFEHINNIIPLMNELHRVSMNNAPMYIICPYWTHKWAVGDIDHKRMINELTFLWFDKQHYQHQSESSTSSPMLIECNWEYNPQLVHWEIDYTKPYNKPEVMNICPVLFCRKEQKDSQRSSTI